MNCKPKGLSSSFSIPTSYFRTPSPTVGLLTSSLKDAAGTQEGDARRDYRPRGREAPRGLERERRRAQARDGGDRRQDAEGAGRQHAALPALGRDADGALLTVAHDRQSDLALLLRAEPADEVVHVLDLFAVNLCHHVARAQASLVGRTVRLDRVDEHAARDAEEVGELLAEPRGRHADAARRAEREGAGVLALHLFEPLAQLLAPQLPLLRVDE